MKKIAIIFCVVVLSFCGGCGIVQSLSNQPSYVEVTVEDAVFENKFHFSQLSESDQVVYKEVYQGIINQQEEICVHSNDGDKVNAILHAILYDFSEIFWSDGAGLSTTYDDTYTILEPNYVYTKSERETKATEIENAGNEIISNIPDSYTEYEKIKYVYEYLVNSVEYVEGVPDNQNIYSSLVRKQSVCAGYAKANQYLLEQLGIYCIYVTGTATNSQSSESHAWNIVQCDGNYYYVDVTWADPLFASNDEVQTTNVVYDYLCCNQSTISVTHTIDTTYQYPQCTLDDLNYYRLNNMYYETASEKTLLNAMYSSINKKEECTTYKFSNADVYNKAKSLIVNRLLSDASQYLGRKYHLPEVKCYYKENPELNRFEIFWIYE